MAPRIFTDADFVDTAPQPTATPAATSAPRIFSADDFLPDAPVAPSYQDTLEANTPWWGSAASGVLSGISGLGDLAQSTAETFIHNPARDIEAAKREALISEALRQGVPQSVLDSPQGQAVISNFAPAPQGLGDFMRSAFDTATGVENSTQINPESYWHKFGSYLPGTLMGPGKLIDGIAGTAGNVAKTLAANTALSGGGFGGQKVGEIVGEGLGGESGKALGATIGELLGTGAVATAPYLAQKGYRALFDVPSEEQALLKAFKVPESQVKKVGPALQSLKEQGIITAPESATPFGDISSRLDDAITASRTEIGKSLEGTATTVEEIWPESKLLGGRMKSGADAKAAVRAIQDEQDNLTTFALLKLKPAPGGVDPPEHGQELLSKYKSLERAAVKSEKAAVKLEAINQAIDNTPITGNELWELRQSYDGGASWNRIDPKGKSAAYRAMRDAAQEKILQLAPDTEPLFKDFSAQMQGQKRVDILKGAEQKGTTQGPNWLQKLVGNTSRSLLAKAGVGHMPALKPEMALERAFGPTGVERAVVAAQIDPVRSLGALTLSQELNQPDRRESSQAGSITPQAAQSQSGNLKVSTIPSSNSTTSLIDTAINKAEEKLADQAPVIIEARRIPKQAEEFISKAEGGQQLKGYALDSKGSGVTVATGIDLGKRTEYELKHLGLSEDLINKLKPYLGKTDELAKKVLERKPLRLTKDEANQLDSAVKNDIETQLTNRLDKAGVELTSLPAAAQTVVRSLAYNFGPALNTKVPSLWDAIINEDWGRLRQLLLTTKWKQPELTGRRREEAALLKQIIDV